MPIQKMMKKLIKTCKVTYEVLNDQNLQTKQIKKHVVEIKVENGFTWFLICF